MEEIGLVTPTPDLPSNEGYPTGLWQITTQQADKRPFTPIRNPHLMVGYLIVSNKSTK